MARLVAAALKAIGSLVPPGPFQSVLFILAPEPGAQPLQSCPVPVSCLALFRVASMVFAIKDSFKALFTINRRNA